MKRLLLCNFGLLFCACSTFAQNVPFPVNDAVYKEEHITFIGPVQHHYAICGDTMLNNNLYSQVLELQVTNDTIVSFSYVGGLRTGGQIVRFWPAGAPNEFLLYDFSLEEGDVITLEAYNFSQPVTRMVDSVKMETIAGKLRKVIYFDTDNPDFPEFWMEGIGSNYGLLGRASDPGGDIGYALLCFQHENEYLNLTAAECTLPELTGCEISNGTDEPSIPPVDFIVSPNPSAGEITVDLRQGVISSPWQLKVFDVNGRQVANKEPTTASTIVIEGGSLVPGIYFLAVVEKDSGKILWREKVVVQR